MARGNVVSHQRKGVNLVLEVGDHYEVRDYVKAIYLVRLISAYMSEREYSCFYNYNII